MIVKKVYKKILPSKFRKILHIYIIGFLKKKKVKRYRTLDDALNDQIKIFLKKKAVFIHLPKAAGTSVFNAIYNTRSEGHFSASLIRNKLTEEEWNNAFKFCFVRNPYTRIFSAFTYLKKGGYGTKDKYYKELLEPYKNYSEFLRNGGLENMIKLKVDHFIPQYVFITDSSEKIIIDYVGKHENINSDFNTICNKIGMKNISLKVINKTNSHNPTYEQLYSNELKKIITQNYDKDFEIFEYSKESFF